MSTPTAILRRVESLGWATSAHHVNGVVEMHAVKLPDGEPVHIARVLDGDSDAETYRCACLLAAAVGVDLEDG
jgi:hypothetical protein